MKPFPLSARFKRALATVLLLSASTAAVAAAGDVAVPSVISRGSLRGVLRPAESVQLSARAAGVVEKFGAEEGQRVAKDELLVQLNSDIERAELSRAEAVLETFTQELARATRELDRATTLNKESIGSQKEFNDAQSAAAIADARRKQAVAEVGVAKARLKERAIFAPFSGLVFRRTRSVGEGVERLEPVVRLIDASKLEFVIYAGPELLHRFKLGSTLRIALEGQPTTGSTIPGVVSQIDPTMDPESGTFRVKLTVEPSETAQPGLSGALQLPSEVN